MAAYLTDRSKMKYWKTDLGFAVACMALLCVFKSELLYHMEQYSLFIYSHEFFYECMEQPGGLLQYLGAFLTQFCHFPWLGAALLAALLWLLAFLTRKAMRLEGTESWALSFLPSLMLLLFINRLDYSVYLMTAYGLLFSQILGLVAVMVMHLAYMTWADGKKAGLPVICMTPIVFYPLFGAYAFIAALLMAVSSKKNKVVGVGTAIAACAAVLLFCSYVPGVYERLHRRYLLFAGLPYLDFEDNLVALIPVGTALATPFLIMFARRLPLKPSIAVLTLVAALVCGLSNWDRNFKAVLGMEKACLEQDWERVLDIARKSENPTRAQVIYRNIALYQKGRLTEEMFTYPDGCEPFRTGAQFPLSYVCAAPALHYCGMSLSSDRLAMETSSTYSKNIYFYKYQAKNALVRGEYDLARKYIGIVSQNWFQGSWVKRYKALADNPEALPTDDEFAPTLALTQVNSDRFDTVEPLEVMIFRRFSDQDYVNEQIFEWQMACYMMWKDPSNVMYCLFQRERLKPGSHITEGIAEAAVLFANTSGDASMVQEVAEMLSGHQATIKRFNSFSNAMNMVKDPAAPGVRERFISQSGRSYWFYSVFNEMVAL